MLLLGMDDRAADQLRDLRDDRVSEGPKSVHPSGNPMSHSTHVGFKEPLPVCDLIASGKLSGKRPANRRARDSVDIFSPSDASGVGQRRTAVASPSPEVGLAPLRLWFPLTVGVGHNPDAVASVRGANGTSWYAVPFRVIPARGQVSKNTAQPSTKQRCDVLHEDEARS